MSRIKCSDYGFTHQVIIIIIIIIRLIQSTVHILITEEHANILKKLLKHTHIQKIKINI